MPALAAAEPAFPEITAYSADDALVAQTLADRTPRVRVYRPSETTVVLGRGSDAEKETHLDAIAADRVPLERRRGGGCAVVLDPGNAVVSVALPVTGLGGSRGAFAVLADWLAAALADLGVAGVERDGISDLTLAGRKIGGSCIHQTHRVIYYSTTLLVAPDLGRIERYLAHPPREPDYRRGRSHRDFLGSLGPALGHHDADRLVADLGDRLDRAGLPAFLVPGATHA